MSKEKILQRFKEIGVLHKGRVKLTAGGTANFYCDIKKAFGYADILNALADEVGKKLPRSVTCVASSGYGGLPLGAVVASRFNKKFIAVRDTPKKHGMGGMIDGYIPTSKDVIVVVDDVLTTGSSIKKILAGLKTTKAKISSAIVVVRREEVDLPIPCSHIFTIDEIK